MDRFDYDDTKKCPHLQYVKGRINVSENKQLQAFEWLKFLTFADKVHNAYTGIKYRVTDALNGKNDTLPLENFEGVMGELYLAECVISKIYQKKPKTILSNDELKAMIDAGAMSWVMYQNMLFADKHKMNGIDLLTRLEEDIADADFKKEEQIVEFYGRHKKAKYYVETHYGKFFDDTHGFYFNNVNAPNVIYKGYDGIEVFQRVVATYSGYDYRKHEAEMEERKPAVKDADNQMIIQFYDNYADMKYIIKFLKHASQKTDKRYDLYSFYDAMNNKRDMVKVAQEYINLTDVLIKAGKGNVSDYEYVGKRLKYYLDLLTPAYLDLQADIKKAREQFPAPCDT